MKCPLKPLLFLLVFGISASESIFGQASCTFSVNMVNHNRYAYDTVEECSLPHTVPFGNWGVSSNVGSKQDGEQFKGWTDLVGKPIHSGTAALLRGTVRGRNGAPIDRKSVV